MATNRESGEFGSELTGPGSPVGDVRELAERVEYPGPPDDLSVFADPPQIQPKPLPDLPPLPIGYRHELYSLDRDFYSSEASQFRGLLSGPAGAGKTYLAQAWADRHRGSFPGGVVFVNLGGSRPDGRMPLDRVDVLRELLHALVPRGRAVTRSFSERTALAMVAHVTRDRETLIILDDAADVAQIKLLFKLPPSVALLVTSRELLPELVDKHRGSRVLVYPMHDGPERSEFFDQLMRTTEEPIPQPTQTVPVVVYLDSAEHAERVERAVEDVAGAYGLRIIDREPPVVRSWFRRMSAKFEEAGGPATARRLARELDRAVELRAVDQVQAQVDSAQGDAVAKLLTALADTPNAVIQIGSVLLVKVDGIPRVRNLTQAELAYLQRNPELFHDPAAVLHILQEAVETTRAIEQPGS